MPTTSQLIRKGRKSPTKKLATPGLKSGKGRKKKVAAPQRRGVCTRVYTTTPEEAELGAAQGRARAAHQRHGGHAPTSPARATTCRSTRSCSCAAAASRTCRAFRYKVVRGTLDAAGVSDRKKARSQYGVKAK